MARYSVYFGTFSKGSGNGLFSGEFDDITGSLRLLDNIDIANPAYLLLNGDILYGVSEVNTFNGNNGGGVFSVLPHDNGSMHLLSSQGTNGKSPCHLCIHDEYIFTANYAEGSLSILETDSSFNIKPSYLSLYHHGKGFNPVRQEQPHIHFTSMTPDNEYLAVCDLGLDAFFFYPYTTDFGLSAKAKTIYCPAGSGPRHLIFSNDGRYLYVLTELSNTVLVYRYDHGETFFIQEISTLPEHFSGCSTAAAIHISPDAGFVAASNRGHDSIAFFRINDDGTLQSPYHLMTGAGPRDFRYSLNGKWILSANQKDNSVSVHSIDNPDRIAGQISIPSPVCIVFGGEK